MGKARGVGIVFRFRSVRDEEYLHIVVQSAARPERIPFVAVYLVESLFQRHPPALQFAMHQRQPVHQYGHIVAVFVAAALGHILVQHLQMVVVDVSLVYQADVLRRAVVHRDVHNLLPLYALRLVLDGHLRRSNLFLKQLLPFSIRERQAVQPVYLPAEVFYQGRLRGDVHALVALLRQLMNESLFHRGLAFISPFLPWQRFVVRHHGGILLLRYKVVVVRHIVTFQ